MKNKLLKTILCASAVLPLASCGNGKFDSMLDNLSKGFKLEGTITQTAHWLDGMNGNPTGENSSNTYNLTYYYQNNNDITGVSQKVTYLDTLNEVIVTELDDTFIEGNDGFAYFYDLSYKNKLEAVAAVDSRGMNVNYAYYFDNPFTHIKSSDFTKLEGNRYELERSKAFYLSYILFNQIVLFNEIDNFVNRCECKRNNGICTAVVDCNFTAFAVSECRTRENNIGYVANAFI